MENIVLDSCVFFGMLKYYKIYKTYGENVLLKILNDDKEEIVGEKEKIRLNYASYFEKYEKEYSFDEIVEKIKENYASKISTCGKKIKNLEFVCQGIDPKSKEKDLRITQERMNNAAEKIKALQLEYDKCVNDKNFALIANYKDKIKNRENSLENGILFINIAKRRLKPFIVQPGFDEILNHTMPKEDDADWVVYSEELVEGMMLDYVSLITTHSQKALDDINYLSEQFRKPTKNPNTREMSQDINSNGVFGDALIMAWSNVAGMPLITQNIKDFIYDGRIKRKNDNKRQHIQAVAKEVSFATNALPYSTYELIHNECEFVDEQDNGYALREMFNENYIYNLQRMSGQKQIEKAMLLEEI